VRYRLGLDGWVTTSTENGVAVHVKARRRSDGHLIVTGVLIEADEVTTETLRQVQPSRILAALRLSPGEDDDSGTTLGDLRRRAKPKLRPAKREVIGRPDGSDPDGFYRRFAMAYRSAATESNKPAVILAAENGVPVETVRRWIKEARRRGHLGPGRKGRAG
jgi:hypothetical protein